MPALAKSVKTFHLIAADGCPPNRVAVPEGLSRFVPGAADKPARCEPARAGGSRGPASCLLEPVELGDAPALLVLAPDEKRFRVNGQRLARIATLQERDQLQLVGGETFHVAVHTRSEIGLAPDGRRDEPCAVCHQPLGEHPVYVCAVCRSAVHCNRETDDGDALNCLSLLSECPRCHAHLIREGYAWTPEGLT